MKITIDTDQTPNRIEVKGSASLGELIEFLSRYYPDFTWRDIKIGDGTMFNLQNWTDAMTRQQFVPGNTPWNQQAITYRDGSTTNIPPGTYTLTAKTETVADLQDLFDTADVLGKPGTAKR